MTRRTCAGTVRPLHWSVRAGLQAAFLALIFLGLPMTTRAPEDADPAAVAATGTTIVVPDFGRYRDVERRKRAFFAFLRPIVVAENARIAAERRRLLALDGKRRGGGGLSAEERRWFEVLARRYGVEGEGAGVWRRLLKRVDTVPVELALAQAANESSWGTSRFAREGRNFFGLWCFRPGCGLVPRRRTAGARHEVAVFGSVEDSVAAYLLTLNRLGAYAPLRDLRAAYGERREPVDASVLAGALVRYSERGQDYVRSIRDLIRRNGGLMGG